jgi:hypothetical protein
VVVVGVTRAAKVTTAACTAARKASAGDVTFLD